jgi:hypothetical protein
MLSVVTGTEVNPHRPDQAQKSLTVPLSGTCARWAEEKAQLERLVSDVVETCQFCFDGDQSGPEPRFVKIARKRRFAQRGGIQHKFYTDTSGWMLRVQVF